jgi:hypothetical protein
MGQPLEGSCGARWYLVGHKTGVFGDCYRLRAICDGCCHHCEGRKGPGEWDGWSSDGEMRDGSVKPGRSI